MLKARTQDNNSLLIFCMKETDYMINILASWKMFDEFEVEKTRRDFIYSSGTKDQKQFSHRQLFGIHFWYINQVDDHNNWLHVSIFYI